MKAEAIILCFMTVLIINSEGARYDKEFNDTMNKAILLEAEWNSYKLKFNKTYSNPEEDKFRKYVYLDNKVNIARHNELYVSGIATFSLEMNHFGDLMQQEFINKVNGFNQYVISDVQNYPYGDASTYSKSKTSILKSIDWRQKGYVTNVKEQGPCGSGWAFSATGSLEGQHFRKTGKLVSLSEQNLIDCSGMYGNNGCHGGFMNLAFMYIKNNKGLNTEESYPYKATEGRCEYYPGNSAVSDIGFVNIPEGDEEALKNAVAHEGPMSVAIDSSSIKFQFYKDGVYNNPECSSNALNHGVLVVGYDTDSNNGDYWIVKNSWGKIWGKQGYILMARNKKNHCGIASTASYPVL